MVYARGPPKTAMGAAAKVMIVIMVMAVYFKPGSAKNLARLCGSAGDKPCAAAQSNQVLGIPASEAIDGNTNTCTNTAPDNENLNPWWRVDFEQQVQIGGLKVDYNPGDSFVFSVFVGNYRDNPLSNSPCATNQPAHMLPADVVCNTTLQGQYLFIVGSGGGRPLTLCEVQVFPPAPPNLARMCGKDGKQACKAAQSSNDKINQFSVASNAIDGVISQNNLSTCSQTSLDQHDYSPWWRVDFGRQVQVTGLQVYSSAEGPNALNGFNVHVGNNEVLYSPTGPGPVLLNTPCEIDQNASTAPVSVGATT